jgi:hypothetical protein
VYSLLFIQKKPTRSWAKALAATTLICIGLLNAAKLKHFSLDVVSLVLILAGVLFLFLPLTDILSRLHKFRAGTKEIELVLFKLEQETPLSAVTRAELSGLSAHDIWALDSFAKEPINTPIENLTAAQRVAGRTLVDLNLLTIVGEGQHRTLVVTKLGRQILDAANSLL